MTFSIKPKHAGGAPHFAAYLKTEDKSVHFEGKSKKAVQNFKQGLKVVLI